MSIYARKAKGTRIRDSRGDRVFTVVNYIILTLFGLAALYPLIYVLSASISEPLAVNSGRMKLWPVGFNIEGYKSILSNKWILTGYGNSLFYTVVGTFLNVLVTFMASYSLSRKDMYGHGLITFFMVFTMWFGGGLIPTFLVVKKLGLINTRMVLLLLGLVSVYNCIICRSFISSSIPYEFAGGRAHRRLQRFPDRLAHHLPPVRPRAGHPGAVLRPGALERLLQRPDVH